MGTALVIMKIMPTSPNVDLEALQEKVKKITIENKGKNPTTKTEPVAFGLNAIILNFSIDESNEIDPIENSLKELEEVNSAEVTDFRRAFG